MVDYCKKMLVGSLFLFLLFVGHAQAETDVLDVRISEYVSQVIAYDQVQGPLGAEPGDLTEATGEDGENRTGVSRTGVDLYDTTIYGVINLTNVENIGNQTLVSVNTTINNTNNITELNFVSTPSYLDASTINVSVDMDDPGNPDNISIFIPELRANDTVLLNYTVEGTGVGEPLNFTEIYSFWRVMTGRDVNVTLNATNSFIDDIEIYDLVLTKRPFPYSDVYDGVSYFNFTNLRGEDAANADISMVSNGEGEDYSRLEWNASGGILSQGETRQIIFDATAPENLTSPDVNWSLEDDWGMWMQMGNITADFKMNGSVSGLRLQDVVSVPTDVRTGVSKERVNESWYWNSTINLSHDAAAPVDYNLTEVTLWSTQQGEFSDPGNESTWVQDTNLTATDYGRFETLRTANSTWELNLPWEYDTNIANYSILFNYSYVPVVWVDPSYKILDTPEQYFKLNESISEPDAYLFIEEIYVLLGGYLIRATKEVNPLMESDTANMYGINITLENIGTEQTPDLVTMFDMVPDGFEPLNFNTDAIQPRNMTDDGSVVRVSDTQGSYQRLYDSDYVIGASDTGEISSGPYDGYWGYNIDFSAINATSPGSGRYDPDYADKEVGIAYKIQGNHSLSRIENAYIVGVDPIRLEGASPSQSVASRLGIDSETMEYLVVIASLLVSITLLSLGVMLAKKKN
ncbi:MAG: hypothetical protein ACLFTR_00290 [Candidatus Woesearchaeota archaeon]